MVFLNNIVEREEKKKEKICIYLSGVEPESSESAAASVPLKDALLTHRKANNDHSLSQA